MFNRLRCWFMMAYCDKGREIETMQSIIKIKKKKLRNEIRTMKRNSNRYMGTNPRIMASNQRRIGASLKKYSELLENEKKFNAIQKGNRKIIENVYEKIK